MTMQGTEIYPTPLPLHNGLVIIIIESMWGKSWLSWSSRLGPRTVAIYLFWSHQFLGFPGGSDGKESACNAGDLGSIPGLGRSPGGEHGTPLQYSCLQNPHGQRSLVGYSPWGHKESDTTEWLSTYQSLHPRQRQRWWWLNHGLWLHTIWPASQSIWSPRVFFSMHQY